MSSQAPTAHSSTSCQSARVPVPSPPPTTTVVLPDFFCPVPPATHPDLDDAQERTDTWAGQMGLASTPERALRLRGNNCADFYARITPHAHAEGLQIAVDWHSLGFSFDDVFCDQAPGKRNSGQFADLSGRLLRTLECPASQLMPPGGYTEALRDLTTRYASLASPVMWQRWIDAHRTWLLGTLWMMSAHSEGRLADPNDYLAARIQDSGGSVVTAMIEMANGQEVPEHELCAPSVRALTEMARAIAIIDNEVVSHHKETYAGQRENTLTDIVRRLHQYDEYTALTTVIAMRDTIMTRFLSLRQSIARRAGASAALRNYVECLAHLIRGNIDWSLSCPRYGHLYPPGQDTPAARIHFTTRITDTPTTTTRPLTLPSTGWWWQT